MSLTRVALFVFASLVWLPGGLAQEGPSTYAEDLEAYAEIIRAQADFARALGEARLNYAKAELTEAQAAQEWQIAKQLALLVDRLELQLYRLKKQEYKLLKKAETIEKWAKQANPIIIGFVTVYSMQALNVLMMQYIPPNKVLLAMTKQVPVFEGLVTTSGKAADNFPGGNVGQWLEYIKANKIKVAPWSPGHIVLVEAVALLSEGVDEELAQVQADMEALHNGADPFGLTSPWLDDEDDPVVVDGLS